MIYSPRLIKAKILKRYKRFLADIELENGEEITAHVPNTGSMQTCYEKNWKVMLSQNDNPKRKLKYTLELTHNGNTYININTSMTNHLVFEALQNEVIKEVTGYATIQKEKTIFESRIDFFLSSHPILADAYMEVKNVTLLGRNDQALFPDSVSTRGQKHLKDLIKIKQSNLRAVMLYVVNRMDVNSFNVAKDIDPEYARLLNMAIKEGVEVLAYQTQITPDETFISHPIKVLL